MRKLRSWLIGFVLLGSPALSSAGESNSPVTAWLASQTNIQTWAADFVQTRTFKALTEPLTATGHVWFAEPNKFHWELGKPPQTIAVRARDEMLVIYPGLKHVERYPLTGTQAGPWLSSGCTHPLGVCSSPRCFQAQAWNISCGKQREPPRTACCAN